MLFNLHRRTDPGKCVPFVVSSSFGAVLVLLSLLRHDNTLSFMSTSILFAFLVLAFFLSGGLAHYWLKDLVRSGPFATAALLLLLGFDDFRVAATHFVPSLGRLRYLVPAYTGLAIVILFFIHRSNRYSKVAVVCTYGALAAAVVVSIIGLASKEADVDIEADKEGPSNVVFKRILLPYRPDVYYIVLDSYTSSESLRKYWGYDNSEYETRLEKFGFVIAKHSRAFHQATQISMESTLDMSNDPSLRKRPLRESLEALKRNETVARFEKIGYEIVNLSPFDLGDRSRKYYEYYLKSPVLGTLEDAAYRLAGDSLPGAILEGIGYARQDIGETNMEILSRLADLRGENRDNPFFVYAHLITPHPPNTLYADGRLMESKDRTPMSEESYIEQVEGTNVNVLKMVSSILSK